MECLEEGFEDSVQFYAFEELDSRKISSTNTLERLNREIRRRSSVVGIFPSTDSLLESGGNRHLESGRINQF